MMDNVFLNALMLFGLINGILFGLLVTTSSKRSFFLKLISLTVILFCLTSIKEFLVYYDVTLRNKLFFVDYFQFSLFVPFFLQIAYRKTKKFEKKDILYGVLSCIPIATYILVHYRVIGLHSFLNYYASNIFDIATCFWLGIFYFWNKDFIKKQNYPISFLQLFFGISSIIAFNKIFWILLAQSRIPSLASNAFILHLINLIATSITCYYLSYLLITLWLKLPKKVSNLQTQKSNVLDQNILVEIEKNQDYIEHGITIEKIAYRYQTDSKSLSRAIKHHKGQSYAEYINTLRLEHFINALNPEILRTHTIIGIAKESGFNSKATFNRVFKDRFECTPSAYIQKQFFSTQKNVSK